MMQQFMKELEQDPFDAEEFVERLAWRTIAETKNDAEEDEFNPTLLHESFVQAIKDLTLLQERQQKKCEKLETAVREDEATFFKEIYTLLEQNKQAIGTFQELDGKINHVATKVLHLGDQLDSVNGPRSRVVDAHKVLTHLTDFLSTGPPSSPIFTDPELIDEAADMIQKLYIISQDLPPRPEFQDVICKIERKYCDIEKTLIEDFVNAMTNNELLKMKKIANTLSLFRGYSECIDAYIDQSQVGCLSAKDVFGHLFPLCKYNNEIIQKVFKNPEQVMAKFVLNIYQLKLVEYINQVLDSKLGSYNYLQTLFDLYSKTNQLSNDLAVFNMGNDKNYLSKLMNNIFNKYLNDYILIETQCLRERCAANLQKYYDSKNHHKKPIQSGGFQDLRRDLQAVIGTRANINIAQIEDYGGETFLSEELAVIVLQDTKQAFQRCQLLSRPKDRASNAAQILDRLINSLMIEHVDYAVELGLQAIPVEGSKNPPVLYFFRVIHLSNNILHLIEKQFTDLVVPMAENTPKYNESLQKKKMVLDDIERKIKTGQDRCINAISTWVKVYLQSEQKKSDFKPETDDFDTVSSPACRAVLNYLNGVIKDIQSNLDGNKVTQVLEELGIKLHKVIYDHILQFQYNTAGAMVAICDLNDYRSCIKPLGTHVAELFETLHALCNLLLVKPENLPQVCSEDSLGKLDRTVLQSFIQLRSDYKTQKQAFSRV